jgi:hypothetical protein
MNIDPRMLDPWHGPTARLSYCPSVPRVTKIVTDFKYDRHIDLCRQSAELEPKVVDGLRLNKSGAPRWLAINGSPACQTGVKGYATCTGTHFNFTRQRLGQQGKSSMTFCATPITLAQSSSVWLLVIIGERFSLTLLGT